MDNIKVQHEAKEGLVRVHLQGEIDAQMLNIATAKLVEEMSHCNCNRVLMDHREVELRMSTIDLFNRPKVASALGVPRSSRIAIVYSARGTDYQFVETVGRNRGFNVKAFKDIDEGIKWLKA